MNTFEVLKAKNVRISKVESISKNFEPKDESPEIVPPATITKNKPNDSKKKPSEPIPEEAKKPNEVPTPPTASTNEDPKSESTAKAAVNTDKNEGGLMAMMISMMAEIKDSQERITQRIANKITSCPKG